MRDKTSWKDTKKRYEEFLNIFPHIKNDDNTLTTFNIMSLWDFATKLRHEKRYLELVWIQNNLIELEINTMLSSYFHIYNSDISYKNAREFVTALNMYEKNKLLYFLGIILVKNYARLEEYRKLRNDLMHKLMDRIKSGEDLDNLTRKICEIGFELQSKLHEMHPAWKYIRESENDV